MSWRSLKEFVTAEGRHYGPSARLQWEGRNFTVEFFKGPSRPGEYDYSRVQECWKLHGALTRGAGIILTKTTSSGFGTPWAQPENQLWDEHMGGLGPWKTIAGAKCAVHSRVRLLWSNFLLQQRGAL